MDFEEQKVPDSIWTSIPKFVPVAVFPAKR